uniref:Putative ovule protein n=1 Tax=Solanum chacoense TaxID=4108 RepID=A0A0V0GKG7_SOLCH
MEKTSLKLVYIMALFIVARGVLSNKFVGGLACYTDEDCAYVVKGRHCRPICDWGEICDCISYNDREDYPTTNTNAIPPTESKS